MLAMPCLGKTFFDVMRLNKDVDRTQGAAMDDFNYKIPAGSDCLIYCIPLNETQTNPQITAADNNPTATRPIPELQ